MDNVIKQLKENLSKTSSLTDLDKIYIEYLGRSGIINDLISKIKEISNEEKREYGQKVNKLKVSINQLIDIKKKELQSKKSEVFFDNTLPGKTYPRGSLHIVS